MLKWNKNIMVKKHIAWLNYYYTKKKPKKKSHTCKYILYRVIFVEMQKYLTTSAYNVCEHQTFYEY